jgi:hypothetical protein
MMAENEKNKGNESFKAKEYAAVRALISLSQLLPRAQALFLMRDILHALPHWGHLACTLPCKAQAACACLTQ